MKLSDEMQIYLLWVDNIWNVMISVIYLLLFENVFRNYLGYVDDDGRLLIWLGFHVFFELNSNYFPVSKPMVSISNTLGYFSIFNF